LRSWNNRSQGSHQGDPQAEFRTGRSSLARACEKQDADDGKVAHETASLGAPPQGVKKDRSADDVRAGHGLANALLHAATDLHLRLRLRRYAAVGVHHSSVAGNSARYRRTTVSWKLFSNISFLQATSSVRPVSRYLPPRHPPTQTGRYGQSPHF